MLKPNKTRKSNGPRITADLTSSQLVVAICVALCAALICFSLGVIVGKYDERNRRRGEDRLALKPSGTGVTPTAAKPPVLPAPPDPANKPKITPVSGQGMQTSPRIPVVPASPPAPKFPGPPPKPDVVKEPPRPNEHPVPPAKPTESDKPENKEPAPAPATKEDAALLDDSAKPQSEPPEKKEKAPEKQRTAAKPPELNPVVDTEPAPVAEAAAAKPQDAPTAATEPETLEPVFKPAPDTPPKAVYTVQLAALSSSTREQQALRLKKELESQGLQPELLVTKGGARICVVVGNHPDRKAAQDACNDLRKNKGFSDCFVRTR